MISYESSKWYVKLWRQRWYLYAILLHFKNLINVNFFIELLLDKQLEESSKKDLNKEWKYIKRHVELSKMHKFSAKTIIDRNDI